MKLLNQVKKELEKNKNYDFESEFWDDETLSVLYDAVYAAEKVINEINTLNDFYCYEVEVKTNNNLKT